MQGIFHNALSLALVFSPEVARQASSQDSLAQFLAVCRRSEMGAMGMRRLSKSLASLQAMSPATVRRYTASSLDLTRYKV
jgi:hypothetical protein